MCASKRRSSSCWQAPAPQPPANQESQQLEWSRSTRSSQLRSSDYQHCSFLSVLQTAVLLFRKLIAPPLVSGGIRPRNNGSTTKQQSGVRRTLAECERSERTRTGTHSNRMLAIQPPFIHTLSILLLFLRQERQHRAACNDGGFDIRHGRSPSIVHCPPPHRALYSAPGTKSRINNFTEHTVLNSQ